MTAVTRHVKFMVSFFNYVIVIKIMNNPLGSKKSGIVNNAYIKYTYKKCYPKSIPYF